MFPPSFFTRSTLLSATLCIICCVTQLHAHAARLPRFAAQERAAVTPCQRLLMPAQWPAKRITTDYELPATPVQCQTAGTCAYYSLASIMEQRGFEGEPAGTPVSVPYLILQNRILSAFQTIINTRVRGRKKRPTTLFPDTLTKELRGYSDNEVHTFINRRFIIPAALHEPQLNIESYLESIQFKLRLDYAQKLGATKLKPLVARIENAADGLIDTIQSEDGIEASDIFFSIRLGEWATNDPSHLSNLSLPIKNAYAELEAAYAEYQDLLWWLISPSTLKKPEFHIIPALNGFSEEQYVRATLDIRTYNVSTELATDLTGERNFTEEFGGLIKFSIITQDIQQSLQNKQPVQISMNWPKDLFDHDGIVYFPPKSPSIATISIERLVTSELHAVAIVGYETNAKGKVTYYKIKNSWGNNVGDQGYFYITPDYLRALADTVSIFDWH